MLSTVPYRTFFQPPLSTSVFFFLNDPATPEFSPLPLHAALPILSSQFGGSLSFSATHNITGTQALTSVTDVPGTLYFFAPLDQLTTSTSFRIDYTATPT